MRCIFVYFVLLICVFQDLNAQTGIGTTTPNASARLDVSADNKGFLPPRVTLTSATDNATILSPATGLLIYNTGNNVGLAAGYYFWNGTAWATIATAGGSGSFAASFMRGSRSATQSVAQGGIVSFSAVDNSAGQDISLNNTNGKITLAPGNTYRLIAAVPTFTGGQRPSFMWYNENTSSYVGSASSTYNTGDAASYGAFGVISHVIITPSVSTVLSFRMLSSLNSGSVSIGGNADFSLTGSYPWFEAQVISGNAPVTGQSIEYVSVQSSSQTVVTGNTIKYQTILAGNIPYNSSTGNFTLTAGKTYRLTASCTMDATSSAGAEVDFIWKNAAGDKLGNYGILLSSNAATSAVGPGIADIIYTPTTNTTVSVFVEYVAGTVVLRGAYTNAIIEQIGSSAIVNPWTLAGSNTYNNLGKVGIGNTSPNANLDIRTSPTSTTDPGTGFIGIGTTTTTASAAGAGAIRFNATNRLIEFSNGTSWLSLAPGNSPMYAQFSSNAGQYFNAIGTKMLFQTTNINVGSMSNTNNGTIYLPEGRIYRVDLNLGWANVGWSRFAIYNTSSGAQLSQTAHIEAGVGYYAGTGMTTCFINTSSGAINIEARFVAPLNSNSFFGDTANGGNYPSLTIQTVD